MPSEAQQQTQAQNGEVPQNQEISLENLALNNLAQQIGAQASQIAHQAAVIQYLQQELQAAQNQNAELVEELASYNTDKKQPGKKQTASKKG